MLREAVAEGTELGREAQKYMETGELVPDEVVIGIVRERLAEPDAAEGFLLDGFPRTVPQAEALDGCSPTRAVQITRVVLIDVPPTSSCSASPAAACAGMCGKIYNVTFDPPKPEGVCDVAAASSPARRRQRGDGAQPPRRLRGADRAPDRLLRRTGRAPSAFGGGTAPNEVYEQVGQPPD